MDFNQFSDLMPKIKKIPLAGIKAHLEMAPLYRQVDFKEDEIEKRKPLRAGVSVLFYPDKGNQTQLILILRNTYEGVHSGQMGFPGGREEIKDKNLEKTALRETYEEVGILPSKVKIIREMTKLYIPPSNFWVHPFLAIATETPRFRRQESEVKELVPVSFEEFMDTQNITSKSLETSYGKFTDVPAFFFNNKVVWGATAMMLNEVKSLFKHVL